MLAATLSPSYGIYSGYEHFENVPVREGSEEYVDSEKYEAKERDLNGPLLPMVQRLNDARRANPALHHLDNVWFLETENDALIAYAKRTGGNIVVSRREHRSLQQPRRGSRSFPPSSARRRRSRSMTC